MPETVITTSGNIASLDSKILASLCDSKFHVDIQPSVFIGSGALNVLGASVKITSPTGVIIKNYSTSGYDISGGSPAMSGVVEVNIPKQGGTFQYGPYTVDVKLTDEDGTQYTVSKPVKICEPDKNHKTRNYGSLSAKLNGVCRDGKLFVVADTPPNYRGLEVDSQVNDFKLLYPTVSELDPFEDISKSSFSVKLYEGVYNFSGTICATYNGDDNIFYEVLYNVKAEKDIKCIIDECCIFGKLEELHNKLSSKCTQAEIEELTSIAVDTLRLWKTAILAAQCGQDPSDYIAELEKLLGCKCTCNCNEGTPIINNNPAKDFVFDGCGFTKETVGLTDYITFNNYGYLIDIPDNGGVLTVGSLVVQGCTVTIPLNFDITKVYDQIKTSANGDADFWASVVSKSLNSIDPSCIGLTQNQWNIATFKQRIEAIINVGCTGGKCSARIANDSATPNGADAEFEWDYTVAVNPQYDLVDIFIDDILVGTVKASKESFIAAGWADGDKHTYSLVSKCSNGVLGNALDGEFTFVGCPTIAVPVLNLYSVTDDCPYDLTSLVQALPSGIEAEWHNANNTKASSLVADPENAIGGVYYVFAKNADNCYSLGVKLTLVCNDDTGCSAPQNVTVETVFEGFRVRFQSAAFPPPGGSYTVKRRLASDPDVDGSYSTVGTPTYNSGADRWEIVDSDASNNILYVYKVISNCTSSSPYVLYEFANITCPTVTLTPHDTTVDYSFVPNGGGITKYEVEIWSADGLTKIHTDTKLPAFSNPSTGTFVYLDGGTTYKVRLKIYIGTYSTTCAFTNVTTSATYSIAYSNNSHAADPLQLLIGNNNTSPSTTIFNGNYDTDPITGTDVNLPAVNANVLFAIGGGKIFTSVSCNGVAGATGSSSVSWANVNGSVNIAFTSN